MDINLMLFNFFKTYGFEHKDGLLFKIHIGGSKGGNCYGDFSEKYDVDYDEQEEFNFFLDTINYYIKEKFKLKDLNPERTISYSYYNSEYDESDYYGNYNKYNVYIVPFESIYEAYQKVFDNIIFG